MKSIQLLTTLFFVLPTLLIGQIDDPNGDPIDIRSKLSLEEPVTIRAQVDPVPAGDAIEGDYLAQPSYTPDGNRFLIPNRTTDNVTVFDANSLEILANIPTWDMPFDIGVTDEYLVVPCYGSNTVSVFELATYTEVQSFPTADNPVKVVVSADGTKALVGTDANVGLLIDLEDFSTVTIPDFPCNQYKFSFITSNTRNTLFWTEFGIAPDNSYLLNGAFDDGLRVYDATSGTIINTISEVPYSGLIRLSGDQSTWVAMGGGDDALISRLNATDGSYVDQVAITGQSVWSCYGGPGVNVDGTRAIVPAYPGNLALVRFDMGDFLTIPIGTTPNWVGHDADHSHGVVGSYYLSLVDFATGQVTSQSTGRPIQNGTVSPATNQLIGYDPLRLEALHIYSFNNSNTLSFEGTRATGSVLEADATYSVQFISDTKGIALNSLSGTLSVFNHQTLELEALIPLGSHETYYAAVDSDASYAYVARRLENDVVVVDLQTYEVVATVSSGGDKPDQVFILPGEQYAYVLNAGGTDRIGVIELDGANSSYVESFPVGNVGISWTNYGIRSNIVFSPDGQYAILPAPFDEQVQIIDVESHEIVAELDIEGFPLRVAVGSSDFLGTVAAVMLKNSGEVAIITNIGPGASITEGFPCGGNPVDIAFGIADDGSEQPGFYISSADDKAVNFFDLDVFEVAYSDNYGPDHSPTAVAWSDNGGRFTLVRSTVSGGNGFLEFSGDIQVEFPDITTPVISLQDPVPSIAMVPSLSQDQVLVFQTDIVGTAVETINTGSLESYQVYPQPAEDRVWFEHSEVDNGGGWIRIYDTQGRICQYQEVQDLQRFGLPMGSLPKGIYWYQIGQGKRVMATGSIQKQ